MLIEEGPPNLILLTFRSLSTRAPGRRDTCHFTDFFQTFTVYEGQESRLVQAQIPGVKLTRKMHFQRTSLTVTECHGFYYYYVQCLLEP